MLKQTGCGQDPSSAEGTQEGELTVKCPTCPHPGHNLPEGWENAPPEVRCVHLILHLYQLLMGI